MTRAEAVELVQRYTDAIVSLCESRTAIAGALMIFGSAEVQTEALKSVLARIATAQREMIDALAGTSEGAK